MTDRGGAVLTRHEILSRLSAESASRRLVVTPLLCPEESVGAASVDVRLGNQFIVMKREAFPQLDVCLPDLERRSTARYQERVIRKFRQDFILHPRQLILGSTLEYVRIPDDLVCYVTAKSTWGRMGLLIATAIKVDPGFKGCITLEIINEGEVPVVLYPGVPIAQLVLHGTTSDVTYQGKYAHPIGPEFPRFDERARSWSFWLPQDLPRAAPKPLRNKGFEPKGTS